MITVTLQGIGEIRSWYLSDKEIKTLGKTCKCLTCGNGFTAGAKELSFAKLDDKFRPVKKVEVFVIVDANDKEYGYEVREIAVKDFKFSPDALTFVEQAILYGVQGFTTKVCPDCFAVNREESEDTTYFQGNGSGTITGEFEGN